MSKKSPHPTSAKPAAAAQAAPAPQIAPVAPPERGPDIFVGGKCIPQVTGNGDYQAIVRAVRAGTMKPPKGFIDPG